MAIWDFRPKGDLWTGVAVGAGLLAAPLVIPLAWSATRPVLKAVLKGGFMLYETGRQILGDATEGPGREKAKGIEATRPASARRTKKDEPTEEVATARVRAVEERARGGRAKPPPRAQKQRKRVEEEKPVKPHKTTSDLL
ncbi:MAG: hypothetical protein ACLP5H_10580 [Desulfomonilaceae bacterium]